MSSVVPPQFSLTTALCSRLTSAYAVTGIPVPVYFRVDFFGKSLKRHSATAFCEGFQPMTLVSISPRVAYSS